MIGRLTAAALDLLLEVVEGAELLLDLSEVREVDSDAVPLLARLAPEQFERLACPRWLAFRVERERWPGGAVGRVA